VPVLGRFQRATTVLRDPGRAAAALRRRTGGVCLSLGAGQVYVAITTPRWTTIWEDATPRTILQRAVRPLLRGLSLLGPVAQWSGLDWISVAHRPVAWVGWEIAPSDATLFEAVVAVRDPFLPPADTLGYPKREEDALRDAKPMTLWDIGILRGAEEVADHIARGLVETLGLPVEPGDLPTGGAEFGGEDPPVVWGPPREDAIGFLEAGLALEGGRIARARLCGDFYADSGATAEIERFLQGQPPESTAMSKAIDQALAGDRHVVDGIRRPGAILGAFLFAADRALRPQ